jgi:hypothetical protein
MFTDQYYNTLKRSQAFQQASPNWAGYGSYQYIFPLKKIVKQYKCSTMLDYGCGKGLQYTNKNNFANLIGISQYILYDPAYEQHAVLPDGKWDMVVCLDVLPFIPEADIDAVIDLMLGRCTKICVIALHKITRIKTKKPLVCIKDYQWWQEKLSHNKIQLIWTADQKPFDYSTFL